MVRFLIISLTLFFSACSSLNSYKVEPLLSYNIRFVDNISYDRAINVLKENKLKYNDISKSLKLFNIEVSSSEKNKIDNLKFNKDIKYIDPDQKLSITNFKAFDTKSERYVPDDPLFPNQWNIQSADIDSSWLYTTGNKNITVAVIDSGVDMEHPDLKGNLLPLIDIWSDLGRKDIYGYLGINIDYEGKDGNGHGTHVTGILGAVLNNNQGIAGIVNNIKILPIKASNHKGETSASVISRAILKAVENNVNIINISIGGPKSEGTQTLKDAVNKALENNIVFISATGNESERSKGLITDITVPAAYPGVLAVGAINRKDQVAEYSNGGNEISLVAPGGGLGGLGDEKIYSTFPTYKTYLSYTAKVNGPYALLSGTSMACPHVAGAAALILSREPELSPNKLRIRLLSSTVLLNNKGFDKSTGYGKLNVYQSLIQKTDDKKNY